MATNDLMVRTPLSFAVAPPVAYSQAQLVNAAIAREPGREGELVDVFMRGWEFVDGQLGGDGLPLAGQLPRPTRGGVR